MLHVLSPEAIKSWPPSDASLATFEKHVSNGYLHMAWVNVSAPEPRDRPVICSGSGGPSVEPRRASNRVMQRATGSFVVPSLDEEDKCPSCLPNRELLQVLLYTRFCLRRGVPDFEFSNDGSELLALSGSI